MMTNVRASNLHPTLQEDILRSWPLLTNPPFCLSSILLPFAFTLLSRVLAEFPVCRGRSRASCASLPSCLQREQPSSRRFGKLPLFLSCANILRPRRDASRRDASAGQTKRSKAQFRKDAAKDPVGFQNTVWFSRKGRNDSFRVFLRDASWWCRRRSWLAERKSFVGRMLLFGVSVLIRTP